MKLSEDFHHPIHLVVGLIIGFIYYIFNPGLELDRILFFAGLGSLIPDIDHVLFMYFYGRSTEYAKIQKKYLKNFQIRKFINFSKNNHKKNKSVYTHNIITILVILFITITAKNSDHVYLAVFLISCIFHYILDIFEDFLYFGSLNSNWFLRFTKSTKDLEEF